MFYIKKRTKLQVLAPSLKSGKKFCSMCFLLRFCIVLYYEALYCRSDWTAIVRIGIPRELFKIRTQPWLSERSLTCDPYISPQETHLFIARRRNSITSVLVFIS